MASPARLILASNTPSPVMMTTFIYLLQNEEYEDRFNFRHASETLHRNLWHFSRRYMQFHICPSGHRRLNHQQLAIHHFIQRLAQARSLPVLVEFSGLRGTYSAFLGSINRKSCRLMTQKSMYIYKTWLTVPLLQLPNICM